MSEEETEVKEFNPKEIEAAMIKAAEDHSNDITGMAMNTYTQLHPRFMAGLHRISSKGRLRLLKAMVDYPINPGKYLLNDVEKEMLEIGSMLLESKFIMIMNTYAENLDVLVAADNSEEVDLTDVEKDELLINAAEVAEKTKE